jgi:tetratricopeptide (TPR) repeat protein
MEWSLDRTCLTVLAVAAVVCMPAVACGDDGGESALSAQLESMSPEERLSFLRDREAGGDAGADVYFQLGNTFFSMEELDSAVVYYARALEVDTTFSKAWVNMGLAYDSMRPRQRDAAQRAFEEALEINPRDVLAMCHLGFMHFSRGATSKAMDLYTKAIAIDPNSAQAHYNLGLAFADAKIFREALLEWEKVIELDDGELGKTAAENVELIRTYMELDED